MDEVDARRDLFPAPGLGERDEGFGEADRTESLSEGCNEGDLPAVDGERDCEPWWDLWPVTSDSERPLSIPSSVRVAQNLVICSLVLGDKFPSPKALFPGSKLFCLDTGAGSICIVGGAY